ncbi:YunG family protein [Peribacillus glennii]
MEIGVPANGQCSVSGLVIHDLFKGETLKMPLPDGWHFNNKIKQTTSITSLQFRGFLLLECSLDHSEN